MASASEQESKRPHDTPFKQQRLRAWQPILTPRSVITTFVCIGVLFIVLGVVILDASSSVIDAGPFRYDEDDDLSGVYVTFSWPEDTDDTVYLYYQLSNFYQNHRRYVKSRSDIQLSGSSLSDVQTLGDCDPWETFADHIPSTYSPPEGTNLDSLKLNPCGLIANSVFNDTLTFYEGECQDEASCATATEVSSTKNGIAWSSDRSKKFKNYKDWDGTPDEFQQRDVEDEEFIVWMRTAGLPTFKKLHRIIKGGLRKGRYTMWIDQHFPVHSFDGEKAFYLTTTTWIGGKNDFLGWAYVVVGIVCMVLAIAFFIKHKIDPRPLGDPNATSGWQS